MRSIQSIFCCDFCFGYKEDDSPTIEEIVEAWTFKEHL